MNELTQSLPRESAECPIPYSTWSTCYMGDHEIRNKKKGETDRRKEGRGGMEGREGMEGGEGGRDGGKDTTRFRAISL